MDLDRIVSSAGDMARRGFVNSQAAADHLARLLQWIDRLDAPVALDGAGAWLDVFERAGDPDQALTELAVLVEAGHPAVIGCLATPQACTRLALVLGGSQALAAHLRLQPEDAAVLHPASHPWTPEAIRADVLTRVGADPDAEQPLAAAADAANRLRRANRRHLVRIAARDLESYEPERVLESIAFELAALADAVMEAALAVARAEVADHAEARLAVVGLGKCGAQELNYISDIDVLFVAEPAHDGVATDRAMGVATRLAAALTRICSAHTSAGSIWQVDAGLRPEGKAGPLVRSLASMRAYYERWASNWEFQAMLKARPMAGDAELGGRFVDLIDPMVWRAGERPNFISESQAMRRRVVSLIPAREAGREIKLGSGGLRDVEFTVQLLQLVHGRADERLRTRATLPSLARLAELGYIGRADSLELATAYRFQRTLEHRVQLWHLRRTHLLPDDDLMIRRLARSLGVRAEDDLVEQFRASTRKVLRLHERVFYSPLLEAVRGGQLEAVRAADVAELREPGQAGKRGPGAQPLVGPAVDEL